MVLFDPEVYLRLFELYNNAIWPAPIIAFLLAIGLLIKVFGTPDINDRAVSLVISGFWLWTGIAYHMLYYAVINWAAWVFGLLFIVQGFLFLWVGIVRCNISFCYRSGMNRWLGLLLLVVSVSLAPVLVLAQGEPLIKAPIVGITPDPTVAFTFGLLIFASDHTPLYLYIIPTLWCVIAVITAWLVGSAHSLVLPLACFVALGVAVKRFYVAKSKKFE